MIRSCSCLCFLCFSFFKKNLCSSNYVKIEDMLWIEDIIATPPFFTISRVDMADFVDSHKVIIRRRMHF